MLKADEPALEWRFCEAGGEGVGRTRLGEVAADRESGVEKKEGSPRVWAAVKDGRGPTLAPLLTLRLAVERRGAAEASVEGRLIAEEKDGERCCTKDDSLGSAIPGHAGVMAKKMVYGARDASI